MTAIPDDDQPRRCGTCVSISDMHSNGLLTLGLCKNTSSGSGVVASIDTCPAWVARRSNKVSIPMAHVLAAGAGFKIVPNIGVDIEIWRDEATDSLIVRKVEK